MDRLGKKLHDIIEEQSTDINNLGNYDKLPELYFEQLLERFNFKEVGFNEQEKLFISLLQKIDKLEQRISYLEGLNIKHN